MHTFYIPAEGSPNSKDIEKGVSILPSGGRLILPWTLIVSPSLMEYSAWSNVIPILVSACV